MRLICQLILAVCLSFVFVAQAVAQAAPLGMVSVPLASRSTQDIEQAEKLALTNLLVRITGQQQVTNLPGVAGLLDNPDKWLARYSYEQSKAGQQLLVTHFDARAISQVLLTAGAPVWSLSRQPLLLWLVGTQGRLVTNSDVSLQRQAATRGLRLLIPTQTGGLSGADVRGRFMQPVFNASNAYGTDLVATAVVYTGSPVSIRWWLYQGEKLLKQGDASGSTLYTAKQSLVNQLTNTVVERYAVKAGKSMQYQLDVNGVKTLESWHRIDRYFANLAGINKATLLSIDGDKASWDVQFSGKRTQLKRLLTVSDNLVACPQPTINTNWHSPITPAANTTVKLDATTSNSVPITKPTPITRPTPKPLTLCWKG